MFGHASFRENREGLAAIAAVIPDGSGGLRHGMGISPIMGQQRHAAEAKTHGACLMLAVVPEL